MASSSASTSSNLKNKSKSKWLSKEALIKLNESNPKSPKLGKSKSDKRHATKRPYTRKKPEPKHRDSDFERYGIVFPTVEEVMREKQELKELEERIEKTKKISVPDFSPLKNYEPTKTEDLLTCKNLTLDELRLHFLNNKQYLQDIIDGKERSALHKIFKKDVKVCGKYIRCHVTFLVYTHDQIDYLLELIDEHFKYEDQTQYSFHVMMPELCVKIFMDVHNMSKEEAENYRC